MIVHTYETTRTSPFGYYGECSCGHITDNYRATAKEAWQDIADHIGGSQSDDAITSGV